MKPLILIVAFSVAGASAVVADDRGAAGSVEPSLGVAMVLNLVEAPSDIITFHSRSAVRLSGIWKPRPSDVAACERSAQDYFNPSTKLLPHKFKAYHRQYIGIKRGKRRLLYLNAFYSHHAPGPIFKVELANAYDGGDNFWGLVCDPRSGLISEFEKNHGM
jgi:hypothetical protein